jgi:hypothetical protein
MNVACHPLPMGLDHNFEQHKPHPTQLLGEIPQSAALCSVQNGSALPTSKRELVEVHVGHQPKTGSAARPAAGRWFFSLNPSRTLTRSRPCRTLIDVTLLHRCLAIPTSASI